MVGISSRDIKLYKDTFLTGTKKLPFIADETTTLSDIRKYVPDGQKIKFCYSGTPYACSGGSAEESLGEGTAEILRQVVEETPLHCTFSYGGKTNR